MRKPAEQDEEKMKRSEAEKVRLLHSISRLRGVLIGIETAMSLNGLEAAQALMQGAFEVASQISKHDAYELTERDQEKA